VACFVEDSHFTFLGFNREGVYSKDVETVISSIHTYIDVVCREEDLLPVVTSGSDLPVHRCP
jgi:hypothetical protein